MNSISPLPTLFMFGSLILLMVTGFPLAFCLFSIGLIGLILLDFDKGILMFYYNVITVDRFWLLISIPLFIFMASILERSGVAEDLYEALDRWLGRLSGGLANATVVVGTALALLIGESGAAVTTVGMISLPSMLRRGYHKTIALGSVLAGSSLGILIPPSLLLIIYASEAAGEEMLSVGRLFLGAFVPGFLLSLLFLAYFGARHRLQPALWPAVATSERSTWKEKLVSLRSLVLPMLLIVSVLVAVIAGLATPSEAAAFGVAGAMLCAVIHRKLTWQNLKESSYYTLKVAAMILWIIIAARCFRTLYFASGAYGLVHGVLTALPFGRWGALVTMQFILFVLGGFVEPYALCTIALPIFTPVVVSLGFDPIWFGILFIINIQMAYITPPIGLNIFYLKGITPEDISLEDIYRAGMPVVLVQAVVLVLVMVFPQIVMWLPSRLIR